MKNKLLPWIISLSALLVSGSAAFYSVSGLGKMFAGASLQVMVLGGSLEFAKLVTASLLYQYWRKLNLGLKVYLSLATVILIIITSAGIYGFLSSAYQETSFKVQNQDKNIEILDKNISIIQTEIKNFESQIKQKGGRLGQLTTIRTNLQSTQDVLIEKSKSTNSVRQQIKEVDSEIKRMDLEISVLNDSISSKNTRVASIEKQKLGVSFNADLAKEVGPLKFIAKLTGSDMDSVVNWYIIVLMLVFDPLAIALVVAANFAFKMTQNENKKEKEIKKKIKKDGIVKKLWSSIVNKIKNTRSDLEQSAAVQPDNKIQEDSSKEITKSVPDEAIDLFSSLKEIEEETKKEVVEEAKNEENKIEEQDKYNTGHTNSGIKSSRERFRGNPDVKSSREGIRNNKVDTNPLNLR
jgi:hypothetical protein